MHSLDENGESASALNAVLDQMWARYLPQIRERARVLEAAGRAAMAGTLSDEERQEAYSAAHKLAGTLGIFGLDRGTDLARELELAYAADVGRDTAARLGTMAAEIAAIIESRK